MSFRCLKQSGLLSVSQDLLSLRNNTGFGFWFINMLWVIFNYMVQKDTRLTLIINGNKVQPLGFIFLVIFMTILCLQVSRSTFSAPCNFQQISKNSKSQCTS